MTESHHRPKRAFSRARGFACLAVMLLIVLGFFLIPGMGSLCAAGVGAVAALCPLGILETIVAEKLMVPPLLAALVCMVVIVALLGRAFCSWICPVPHVSSFFHSGKKTKAHLAEARLGQAEMQPETGDEGGPSVLPGDVKPLTDEEKRALSASCHGAYGQLPPVGGKRNGIQVDSRHFVLVGALASSAVFGLPVFCLICPVGLTIGTLVALWIAFVDHNPTWMLLVFPLIIVLELVVFRKWCHVLCPMGALMSLIGAKSPLGKPRVDTAACLRSKGVDCRTCVQVCPEQLDPHGSGLSECTRCGLCKESCPSSAISMGFGGARKSQRPAHDGAPAREKESLEAELCDEAVEYE